MDQLLFKGCPVQFTMQFLAGKWQIAILWNLSQKPLRFGELKKNIAGITDKILMKELRFFEDKEIVYRKKFDEMPPRVEYSLAPLGRSLLPVINQIVDWGYTHLQDAKVSKDMYHTPLADIEEIARLNVNRD